MRKTRTFSTEVVHAGLAAPKQGAPFLQGPQFASTFHLSGEVDPNVFQYGRFSNPTWETLEAALSKMEGGPTRVFPSGMAAVAATLTPLLSPGQRLILPADGYYATRAYAEAFLCPNGIELQLVKTNELLTADLHNAALVMVETPSNPLLDTVDITALAERVHSWGGRLAIDNTTATFMAQQPLLLGADLSVCADTKAVNGHSDILFGHVSTLDDGLLERIELWRKLSGNIPGPMEAWLVQRGLATLDVRLERMVNNAGVLADWLSQHPVIDWVRYPGLANDPSYQDAQKQMRHAGFVITFDLRTADRAQAFLSHSQLLFEATSFGGVHTMAERRARWGTDDLGEGVVRLSVGCEAVDDLINDFDQALAVVKAMT